MNPKVWALILWSRTAILSWKAANIKAFLCICFIICNCIKMVWYLQQINSASMGTKSPFCFQSNFFGEYFVQGIMRVRHSLLLWTFNFSCTCQYLSLREKTKLVVIRKTTTMHLSYYKCTHNKTTILVQIDLRNYCAQVVYTYIYIYVYTIYIYSCSCIRSHPNIAITFQKLNCKFRTTCFFGHNHSYSVVNMHLFEVTYCVMCGHTHTV